MESVICGLIEKINKKEKGISVLEEENVQLRNKYESLTKLKGNENVVKM